MIKKVLGMCDKEFHYFFSLEVLWVLLQKQKIHFTFTSIDCDLIFSEAPKAPPSWTLLFQICEANAVVASFAEYDSC
jgi:hypothetical protein